MEVNSSVMAAAAGGDPVALTRILVATPSVNPSLEDGGAGEREIAGVCGSWLRGWGFDVSISEPAPGRYNVVARKGSGPRRLLLNGHLDTVGVKAMSVAPFGAEVREGRIWGRGACDMKAGIGCILACAAALQGARLGGELVIALTADEEHASVGMQALVDAGLRAAGAIVCEPTSLAIMPAHKGFVWVDLEFRGRAAHGSRPEVGVDAIRHAGVFLSLLDVLEKRLRDANPHPLLGWGSVHAGTIRGGTAPSVYPARCSLSLERRTLPGELPQQVLEEVKDLLATVRALVPEIDAQAALGLTRPGTEVLPDCDLVRLLQRATEAEGIPAHIRPMTAWVDAAWLNETGTPAVCFGPGDIEHAHTADESVPASEVALGTRILIRFVRDFLRSGS